MHPYNSIGIIVVSPDFILFWFYYSVKLSLGWAAVTWRIERQWPKHGSILSSMNPWCQMRKMLQKANQRVTQMLERLLGAYYLITRFSVHSAGSKGALYLVFSSAGSKGALYLVFSSLLLSSQLWLNNMSSAGMLGFVGKKLFSTWANGMT